MFLDTSYVTPCVTGSLGAWMPTYPASIPFVCGECFSVGGVHGMFSPG